MTGIHGLQHVEGLAAPAFAQNDTVRAHAQRILHKVALVDFAAPVGGPWISTHRIAMFDVGAHAHVHHGLRRPNHLERKRRNRICGPCRCGGDMPGRCPGPSNCPMQQEDEDE